MASRNKARKPHSESSPPLRYALDARKPVNLLATSYNPLEEHDSRGVTKRYQIEIQEKPQGPPKVVGVNIITAVSVLGCVLYEPPLLNQLLTIIERRLGRVPTANDALPEPGEVRFLFTVAEGEGGGDWIRLLVNSREVPLGKSADVQKLLREICLHPGKAQKGRALEKRLSIKNVSKAVTQVRSALEKVFPGAGDWLASNPICWREGLSPSMASGGDDTKK